MFNTYFVYILASKRNGTLYIGVTNNLERRVYEHKNNIVKGFFLSISFLKYFIIGSMLLSACLFLEINAAAMSLGLSIVVAVIVMKVGSRLFVNYMNVTIKASNFKH